jgi:predicted lipoprotein with Yx(FWY)xxD motif
VRKLLAGGAMVALLSFQAGTGGATAATVHQAKAPVTLTGKVKDRGTKTVKGNKLTIDLYDFAFEPTYVKAKAGSTLTVTLKNEGKQQHTFSVPGQTVDVTLSPDQKMTVTLSVPTNGALLFYCRIHGPTGTAGSLGMQGAIYSAKGQSVVNPATATPTVALRDTPLGKVLVDGNGRTLYLRDSDTATQVTCTGACATIWPPVISSGSPQAAPGLDSSKLGTVTGANGVQVTYNGHPLYLFAQDSAAGDTKGQGVGGVWWVISADGQKAATTR